MAVARSDPRSAEADASRTDVRPQVRRPPAGLPLWVLIGGMLIAAVLLFGVLDARRRALLAPAVRARPIDGQATPAPIAPLYVPPAPPIEEEQIALPIAVVPLKIPPRPTVQPKPPPAPIISQPFVPPPSFPPPFIPPPPLAPREPATPASALVFDASADGIGSPGAANGGLQQPGAGNGVPALPAAARATRVRQLPTLVLQGTLIPAVLESALDSTRGGPARALVTRDVRGYDGTRLLIPRGSRLIGEYQADLQPGQNRALVTWTRLVRPDGVTIALQSPAGDTLGRVGIKGHVNSHFLERFAAAVLQSSLEVGVNLASRLNSSTVIVGLPNTAQTLASPLTAGLNGRPTLRVRQGTPITVFVARDLDFTAVESGR